MHMRIIWNHAPYNVPKTQEILLPEPPLSLPFSLWLRRISVVCGREESKERGGAFARSQMKHQTKTRMIAQKIVIISLTSYQKYDDDSL